MRTYPRSTEKHTIAHDEYLELPKKGVFQLADVILERRPVLDVEDHFVHVDVPQRARKPSLDHDLTKVRVICK